VNAGASADLSADQTWSISNNGITNALLAQAPARSVVANITGGTANRSDLAATADGQVLASVSGGLAFNDLVTLGLIPFMGFFGLGVDGAVTFDGASTVLGFVPTANRYVVNRDLFNTDCTVNPGVTVVLAPDNETTNAGGTNARRMFGTGTLTNNGRIISNGSLGANASATNRVGGAPNYGTLGTAASTGGATGTAANAAAVNNHFWQTAAAVAGGAAGVAGTSATTGNYRGGGGGGGGTGAGGNGAAVNAMAAANMGLYDFRAISTGLSITNVQIFFGGSGGGGGGGDGTNFGGSGGGPGGLVFTCFRIVTGSGTWEAIGRNGGSGIAGNTGGGAGGGGGTIFNCAALFSGVTIAQCLVTGGTGGGSSGTGRGGGNGAPGKAFLIS